MPSPLPTSTLTAFPERFATTMSATPVPIDVRNRDGYRTNACGVVNRRLQTAVTVAQKDAQVVSIQS